MLYSNNLFLYEYVFASLIGVCILPSPSRKFDLMWCLCPSESSRNRVWMWSFSQNFFLFGLSWNLPWYNGGVLFLSVSVNHKLFFLPSAPTTYAGKVLFFKKKIIRKIMAYISKFFCLLNVCLFEKGQNEMKNIF